VGALQHPRRIAYDRQGIEVHDGNQAIATSVLSVRHGRQKCAKRGSRKALFVLVVRVQMREADDTMDLEAQPDVGTELEADRGHHRVRATETGITHLQDAVDRDQGVLLTLIDMCQARRLVAKPEIETETETETEIGIATATVETETEIGIATATVETEIEIVTEIATGTETETEITSGTDAGLEIFLRSDRRSTSIDMCQELDPISEGEGTGRDQEAETDGSLVRACSSHTSFSFVISLESMDIMMIPGKIFLYATSIHNNTTNPLCLFSCLPVMRTIVCWRAIVLSTQY